MRNLLISEAENVIGEVQPIIGRVNVGPGKQDLTSISGRVPSEAFDMSAKLL